MKRFGRAGGAALMTALFVLIAITIVGLAAAHTALNAEKSARGERDRHIAFQSAEAGLADAEHDIEGGVNPLSVRAMLFASGSAVGFDDGCGRGQDNLGLCAYAPAAPAWQLADLSGGADAAVPYGRFTGAILPTGGGALPGTAPRYVIELMPLARAGEGAGAPAANVYRVTAIGFGVRPSTHVVLQSFYRKVVSPGLAHAPSAQSHAAAGPMNRMAASVNPAGARRPAACTRFAAASLAPGQRAGRSAVAVRGDGTSVLLESSYDDPAWPGQLTVRSLSAGADGAITIGETPLWEAGAVLTGGPAQAPRPSPQQRRIYTLLRKADGSTASVPFEWDALASEERRGLDADRVAFLRGAREREAGQPGGVFRRRASILGDTIDSSPLLVGAPSPAVMGPGYDDFRARHLGRAEAIYLGANDGMLHAFDARDGAELFAYVPNALLPVLGQLSEPGYRHRSYVDASAGHAEALLNGQWRSVLVSGLGRGARGVFALDVSDPAAFDAGERALWEFTEQDDPAIGHVGVAPLIAKVRVGINESAPRFRYFAVVAGDAEAGALFLLALDKPAAERWQRDINYYRLDAPAAVPGLPHSLGQPGMVLATDGSVRYAYAGDSQGTMWRFDLSKLPFSSAPLFEARDDEGRRQPIVHAPRAVHAPGGGYLVLFGTGAFDDASMQSAGFAVQSFYAVKDSAASPIEMVSGRSELARRTLKGAATYTIDGDEFDYTGPRAKKGWYFDFPYSSIDGERLGASPVLVGGTIIVSTIVPGADPCAGASTRSYVIDTLSGFAFDPTGAASSGNTTGKQMKGPLPVILELGAVSGAETPTGAARAIRRLGIVHLQGDGSAPVMQQVDVGVPSRRISWREVANWQELHDAATR
ncbi:MAG: PilC/PilY family type IV pilus protein [Telluria sp.]